MAPKPTPVLDRLMAKVDVAVDGCWTWTGYTNASGYGVITEAGVPRGVHRIAYEHFVGAIPEDLTLDHLCRNRVCVRPDHLEPVTRGENTLRGDTIAARNAAKTHCHRGHEFTPENTYVSRQGKRHCRACARPRWSSEERRVRRRKGERSSR